MLELLFFQITGETVGEVSIIFRPGSRIFYRRSVCLFDSRNYLGKFLVFVRQIFILLNLSAEQSRSSLLFIIFRSNGIFNPGHSIKFRRGKWISIVSPLV